MRRLTRDEVTCHVAADPHLIYDLVSDVAATPRWSPEVIECTWLDGATGPAVGARFAARNRRRWFTWVNKPVVETADPGRAFAFRRTEPGGGSIVWRYLLEPDGAGTTVVESYEVTRPVPRGLHLMLWAMFGVRDLEADLHENMRRSLERLAGVAENAAASGSPRRAAASEDD